MDSPVRQYQKQKDYRRHKLFRKINRRRKAERQQAIDAPMKELKKRLRRFGDGKDKWDSKNKKEVSEWGSKWKERLEIQDVQIPNRPVYQEDRYRDKQGWMHHFKTDRDAADKKSEFKRALYNNIEPSGEKPSNIPNAALLYIGVKRQQKKDPDRFNRRRLDNLADSVADAAWRKYLGYTYDHALLPHVNGDTVRLPKSIEAEIPTDTAMLERRLSDNLNLRRYWKNKNNPYLAMAINDDERALQSLRKTYQTGLPTGFGEFSYNSRNWMSRNGEVEPDDGVPPLNVLHNYNQRYDKSTNRMYYSDTWDLDGPFGIYDKFVGGQPFPIRGYVQLPQHNSGKDSGIHIKPENRGKFTALKKRTGKSASWFKAHGTPAQKKMATFALNARKWKHK